MHRATTRIPYELPLLFGSLHIGVIVAIVITLALGVSLHNTRWGYQVATVGGNRRAAEFAGMSVKFHLMLVILVSGAIAGMAGMIEVAGTAHRLSDTISNRYGWTGMIAASLAGGSPIATFFAGTLLALLLNSGIVLQTQGLNVNVVTAINGVVLLFVAIGEVIARYRLVRRNAEL